MLVWTSLIASQKRRTAISALGMVFGGLLVFQLAHFHGWTWPWLAGFAVVLVVVIRSVGAAIWFFARHSFEQVDIGFSESAVPGGAVYCAVRITARRPVAIREMSFRLTAESRSGAEPVRELCREERTLDIPPLARGQRFEGELDLPVPEDARFSYRSFEGRVLWVVRTRLLPEDGVPVETAIEVLVAPPLAD